MLEMTVLWLVILILMLAVELVTMGLTTIWFAGAALVAEAAACIGLPWGIQILIFLLVSLLLLVFTRPVAVKYFNKDRIRTNAESLIGCQAIVISEIDNLQGVGQVTVKGSEWSARSKEGLRIPVGTVVVVQEISGVKLIVTVDDQMREEIYQLQKKLIPEPMSVSQMEELEDRQAEDDR